MPSLCSIALFLKILKKGGEILNSSHPSPNRANDVDIIWMIPLNPPKNILTSSFCPRDRTSKGHNHQLKPIWSRDSALWVHTNLFYYRIPDTLNYLPKDEVDATTINWIDFETNYLSLSHIRLKRIQYSAVRRGYIDLCT